MQREALVYGQISPYSAKEFIETINKITAENSDAELCVRLNTNGGDVDYGWGMVRKFSEYPNKKIVKVDGKAQSMGLYFCAYAEFVSIADVSTFLLHRASSWKEDFPEYFTEEDRKSLIKCNKDLRAALEGKIDVKKFEAIKKVTLDQVFSMDSFIDVEITAQEAMKIGLAQEMIKITPKAKAAVEAKTLEIARKANGLRIAAESETDNPKPKHTMKLNEFKAEQPALYAEIIEAAAKEAVKKERLRIKAWAKFYDVDAKAVNEGIEGGEDLDMATMAEFFEKRQAKKKTADAEDDSEKDELSTEEPASKLKGEEQKKLADFKASVLENSNEHAGKKSAKA